MARRGDCVICSRPDVASINARIAAGEGGRPLAREINESAPTLHRHTKRCLAGTRPQALKKPMSFGREPLPTPAPEDLALPPPSPEEEAGGPVADALHRLRGIYAKALQRYEDAYDTTDSRLLAAFLPELRKYGQDFLSLTERLAPHQTEHERLMNHPDFRTAVHAVAKALDPHPDARADVLLALEGVLGEGVE